MPEMWVLEKFFVNHFDPYFLRFTWREVARNLDLSGGAEVLEIGAGKGVVSRLAFDTFGPKRLIVTDYDPAQLEEARRYFGRQFGDIPTNLRLRRADALHLPFEDGRFDAVFGFFVLHHVEEHWWTFNRIPKALDEAFRVLRPRGKLVYLELVWKDAILTHLRDRGHREAFRKRYWGIVDLGIFQKPEEPTPLEPVPIPKSVIPSSRQRGAAPEAR